VDSIVHRRGDPPGPVTREPRGHRRRRRHHDLYTGATPDGTRSSTSRTTPLRDRGEEAGHASASPRGARSREGSRCVEPVEKANGRCRTSHRHRQRPQEPHPRDHDDAREELRRDRGGGPERGGHGAEHSLAKHIEDAAWAEFAASSSTRPSGTALLSCASTGSTPHQRPCSHCGTAKATLSLTKGCITAGCGLVLAATTTRPSTWPTRPAGTSSGTGRGGR